MPYLTAIFILTVVGCLLSTFHSTYWFVLVNIAEGLSCYPVIQILKAYASVTTSNHRGSIIVQILLTMEYWFLTTSLLSCFAECLELSTTSNVKISHVTNILEGKFVAYSGFKIVLTAIQANQNNGIDDWARLFLHSVFLNLLDEMEHFGTGGINPNCNDATSNNFGVDSECEIKENEWDLSVPTNRMRQRGWTSNF